MASKTEPTPAKTPRSPEAFGPPDHPRRIRHPLCSMRLIVTSVAVIIITAAVFGASLVAERNTRRALTGEIETRLMLEAHNLALISSDALLSEFPELMLHPLIKEMRLKQPELALAVVSDHEGRIQGHEDSRRLGTSHAPPAGLQPVVDGPHLAEEVQLLGNEDMLVAAAPVTHPGGQVLGAVQVGLRRDYIDGIIGAARAQQLRVLALVLCVGVLATLVTMTLLLKPIAILRQGLERIGAGDLNTPLRMSSRTEFGMLADTVNVMAAELRTAQVEMVEKERLAHELDLAREIQNSLLPPESRVAGGFVIEGSHRAAAEVGGDYYDVLDLPGGKIGVAVADVAGKGLAGCLVMSMLSALLRALRDRSESPSEVLAMLDERLGESLRRGTFVTMFYGILDPGTGRLVYASAGHSPLLIFRARTGEVEQQATRGIPLASVRGGVIKKTLQDHVVDLERGDLIVQYTDGINEAFDASGVEQFGFDRLETLLAGLGPRGSTDLLEGVRTTLDTWRGGTPRLDDETLLVIRRDEATAIRPVSATHTARPDGLRLLERARSQGHPLTLPSTFDEPAPLRAWLEALCGSRMGPREVDVVYSALYEACANVAEHGYDSQPGHPIELWWACESITHELTMVSGTDACSGSPGCLSRGHFLIRDQGKPFSADNWRETDFSDRKVWSRGRGFGLDIIHRAMADVSYQPSTAEGNLTIFSYEFQSTRGRREEPKRA